MTVRQRLQQALEARGWVVDPNHPTRKYTVMRPTGKVDTTRYEFGDAVRYFIGRFGALRFSPRGLVTASISAHKTRMRLLAESNQGAA